jgi:hypothetical protein
MEQVDKTKGWYCSLNHGPHHGTYACMAHGVWELWFFGILLRWETFDRADDYLSYIQRSERMIKTVKRASRFHNYKGSLWT